MASRKAYDAGQIQGNWIGGPDYTSKAWKARNRSPKTRAELEHALAARESIVAVSAEIRRRAGLEPLEDGQTVSGWRSRLAALPETKAKRKAAPKRQVEMSLEQTVRAAARRRREIERERKAIDAELGKLVAVAQAEHSMSISAIAEAVGVSRQRIYQLASC